MWRATLHMTYVGTGRTQHKYPLNRQICREQTVTRSWIQSLEPNQPLGLAIQSLPPYLREAVGEVNFPDDNGIQLIADMRENNGVHAWSDGTVKHAKGAHAYTLRTKNDDENKCVTGTAMTPIDLSSLNSLRTEHYGALGVAVIMYCLAKIHRKRSEASYHISPY